MKIKNMKNTLQIIVIVLFFSALNPTSVYSINHDRIFSYETEGWIIDYEFTNYRAEPKEEIIFTISIYSKKDNYDFRVWIESPYLSIEKKFDESNLYFKTLPQGETLKGELKISIPEMAEYGDIYNVIVRTESHSNKRVAGIRAPSYLDAPEYIFSNINKPDYDFKIYIQSYPILTVKKSITILQKGKVNKFELKIMNTGNGNAENIHYEFTLPNSFYMDENNNGEIIIINGNSHQELVFNIKPEDIGTFDAVFYLQATNHEYIEYEIRIEVQDFQTILKIIGFAVILILAYISYKIYSASR